MKAITEKLKQAVADLRPAFDQSGLVSLWLTLSREGAIIGTIGRPRQGAKHGGGEQRHQSSDTEASSRR